jgi:SpoVK/Ycf46/Vps4 family AAA+-type ATPase
MLPKLQDLKQYGEKHELIFIIATNYKERLDSAITRPGRIDDLLLVTPPDFRARQLLVRRFLEGEDKKETRQKQQILPTAPVQLKALLCTLAAFTSGGWIYTEIKMLVEALLAELKESHNMSADKGSARPSPDLLAAIAGGEKDAEGRLSELARKARLDKRSFDMEEFYASRPEAADEKERVRRTSPADCGPQKRTSG